MVITNRHNLPTAIVTAMEKIEAKYDAGDSDRTVSSLHEPPRSVLLKQQFRGELSADVSERIASLLGSAFHHVMEQAAPSGAVVEERFSTDVLGWKISGAVDIYHEATAHIQDYKVLSVWAVTIGDAVTEYTKKLNTYAYILRANGRPVKRLSILVLFRDWQAREARRSPDYPQQQIIEYDLDVWPEAEAELYVKALTDRHQTAQVAFDRDGELPECTDDEKWAKPTTYAAMKPGAKRASKVFEDHNEATAYAGSQMVVETRHGEYTKCMHFCNVRSVCSVGKSLELAAEAAF